MTARAADFVAPALAVAEEDGTARLLASRCRRCDTLNFPRVASCPNPTCPEPPDMEDHELGATGTLWSWCRQMIVAPSPFARDEEGPYTVGMVDLPDGIRILGMLTDVDDVQLRPDMPVTLVARPLCHVDGDVRLTWMWSPAPVTDDA